MAEMSPVRRRMIEDMTVRNLPPATQRSYIHAVAKFSRYFGPLCHAVGAAARHSAHLLASGATAALALSRPRRQQADQCPGAACHLPFGMPGGGLIQASTVHTLRHSFATHALRSAAIPRPATNCRRDRTP
jgi:hypothetical protein